MVFLKKFCSASPHKISGRGESVSAEKSLRDFLWLRLSNCESVLVYRLGVRFLFPMGGRFLFPTGGRFLFPMGGRFLFPMGGRCLLKKSLRDFFRRRQRRARESHQF
ncbi:hypothetical protein [Methanimicrococcus hongohii]|uniref:hypothetical protein n=1 Tax=Methanimicrococcus hongohii TaxID=3028295 RepID=UPI0029313C30|nr:hypothetical protein [Methanimicrococcus sp. Hf6]